MPRKIAYIQPSTRQPANASFHRMLIDTFSEFEVVVIDVAEILHTRRSLKFLILFHAFREYGWEIVLRRKKLSACRSKTAYFQGLIKQLVREVVDDEFVFSIQIQSLFDASIHGLKHYVYTDHTHLANLEYESFEHSRLHSAKWLAMESSIYDNADAVFVRSTNIAESLVAQYGCPPEKVECVYAGSNAALPQSSGSPDRYKAQSILFVGREWVRKGGPVLISAFQGLGRTHPNARLTIVGTAPDVDVPNCEIVGLVPVDRVQTYFEQASIFCMPTEREPFGVVFVEALSHSLPIVATNIGAVPDMVVDDVNGYLIEPGDVAMLTRRLSQLLEDPEKCRAFGIESHRIAEERYNWEAVGAKIRARVLEDARAEPAP